MRRASLFVACDAVDRAGRCRRKAACDRPKPVCRIDSLIATAGGRQGHDSGQRRGAERRLEQAPMLKPVKRRPIRMTIVVEFLATPPPPDAAVIQGLLPVSANTTVRMRKGVVVGAGEIRPAPTRSPPRS